MSQEENPNIIHVEDLNFHVMIPIPGHPHQLLGLSDVNLLSFVLRREGWWLEGWEDLADPVMEAHA